MPFSIDPEKNILEAYFRNGERDEQGGWKYSVPLCAEEFFAQFPNDEIDNDTLVRHVYRIVDRFRQTGSVCKGKSPGRRSVLTDEVVEDVRTRLEQSPTKPLRQLAQQTGLSYSTAIFFEDTVTAARYRVMLQQFIAELDDEELQNGYFQHDNASAHTSRPTLNYLQEFFDDRIISAGRWPPRSPDLTPLDYH